MELPRLLRSATELQQLLLNEEYQFCIIGGVAVQRWGEPRGTRDIDLSLLTGFGSESRYIDTILSRLHPRIEDAAQFALLNRVLLVRDDHGVDIDISLGAMPFEERAIQRASKYSFADDCELVTCSATDLIVHKAFADRDQDWVDIRGVLIRSRSHVEWNVVLQELTPLVELKEEPVILDRLQQVYDSTDTTA